MLRAAAEALGGELRGSDLLARWGGEEFLVYLPDATAEHAAAVAQRLCRAVQSIHLTEAGEGISVTVSIGMVCVTSGGESWAEWLGAADQALYDAKHAGRNRVVVAAGRQT